MRNVAEAAIALKQWGVAKDRIEEAYQQLVTAKTQTYSLDLLGQVLCIRANLYAAWLLADPAESDQISSLREQAFQELQSFVRSNPAVQIPCADVAK